MRAAGILLHISSLPNRYGIGTLGAGAYDFVDFLKKSGQKLWQILPINPTSYGDSPYQSFSTFAGNPYFIDFDLLNKDGLLKQDDYLHLVDNGKSVDYEKLFFTRFEILKLAFERFKDFDEEVSFINFKAKNNYWLKDYALYMSLKNNFKFKSWLEWPFEYRDRNSQEVEQFFKENYKLIEFWKFVQYLFYQQWDNLKKYANQNDVLIIGDMPIYTALDSADCWARPFYWKLDSNYKPTHVAGVPPDLFSPTGQLWGNPLYDYRRMEEDNYSWWVSRIKQSDELFDYIRIDHFRGFEAYYSIAYSAVTAENGKWIKGPGLNLFKEINKHVPGVKIIAEDLGLITPEVEDLLKECGFPGMKVLQFGFSPLEDSTHSPHNHTKNSVCYPGTHDNPPLLAWYQELSLKEQNYIKEYLQVNRKSKIVEALIRECLRSVSRFAVIPMQDYLHQGSDARMNTPATIGGNWTYRIRDKDLSPKLIRRIKKMMKTYYR